MNENRNKEQIYYTLITGSSQGIGRAMAAECARRGMSLLLVALDTPDLASTANDLRHRYGVKVDTLAIDLTADDAPRQVFEWCVRQGYSVNVLINNAGFGRNGIFETRKLEEYKAMVRLNNQAMMELTHYFLPMLRRLPKAHLLNMSSMEATLPIPYKSVYTGTKHFVYAFTLALREELKGSPVKVSVLCPGPTLTNEDGLKRVKALGWQARLLLMLPDQVAAVAIPGMLRGQAVIIPGILPKVLVFTGKIVPTGLKMYLLGKIFKKYRE